MTATVKHKYSNLYLLQPTLTVIHIESKKYVHFHVHILEAINNGYDIEIKSK